jgi:pSer/pThr/pTyr-binding forkhead associated (FHA) protein
MSEHSAEGVPQGRTSDTTRTFAPVAPVPDVDADLRQLTADDHAAISALPNGSALLVVVRGPNTGSRFLLDSERTSAGRHTSSEIFLDDVTVSRRHAEFLRDGDTFRVHDVGSLNGTYVNRERVDDSVLQSGDEVQIGRFRMLFHLHPTTGRAR